LIGSKTIAPNENYTARGAPTATAKRRITIGNTKVVLYSATGLLLAEAPHHPGGTPTLLKKVRHV
jgi:hypothetical protein